MNKYDFDSIIDRRSTFSCKWGYEGNKLPMWVADMDFKSAPEILEALQKRLDNGIFGYTYIPDEWYEAYQSWWKKRHNLDIAKEYLIFCTGVVPAISTAVRKLTSIAENVVIQTPVYNVFFNSIKNNGRNVLESPLVYSNGEYSINWEDLEEKLADPQTSLMILCNPHNPIGKIWDKQTLERIGNLCEKYNVTVISDEIHCDLIDPEKEYIPFASVSETCANISVTCIAPTKTFNIAGLQTAAVMIPNDKLNHKMWRALNTDEVAEPNAFAVDATIAAFTKGGAWLDALREYIKTNKDLVRAFIREKIPEISVVQSEATYLLWLDCTKITNDSIALTEFIRNETGLFLSNGTQYGGNGNCFMRFNPACPRKLLQDGLSCLKQGIDRWKSAKSSRL
jgi:cystathionine beta-lyase